MDALAGYCGRFGWDDNEFEADWSSNRRFGLCRGIGVVFVGWDCWATWPKDQLDRWHTGMILGFAQVRMWFHSSKIDELCIPCKSGRKALLVKEESASRNFV
jgi:hypothetical protein